MNRLIGTDWHTKELQFEHLNEDSGLNSDIVHDFMPWSEQELLIQCNNAISILNTENGTIVNYGKSFFRTADNRPFNMGEVGPVDLGDGRVMIAPHDGMMVMDKSTLQPDTVPVRIALTAIVLEGKSDYAVDYLSHLTLTSNERSLGIRFAALDYRGTEDIQYQTRFYPADKSNSLWNTPTELSTIIIQDLKPGKYIFEVRSTNALGQWQNNTRQLYVSVTPTFWESTLGKALTIGFLLIVTIVITILSLRYRATRKEREEALHAYLDMHERLSAMVEGQKEKEKSLKSKVERQETAHAQVPEILVTGRLSKDEEFINALHKFLEENIGNSELVIDDLANQVCMSRSSLNRKMQELFNLSAKDFIQAARIKHACQLLKNTDMNTKEVAYACGFSDPKYFAKCFKSETGKTTTEFRSE